MLAKPLLLLTTALLLPGAAVAACLGPAPTEAATQLFTHHRDFAFKAPDTSILAPRLIAALHVETQCSLSTGGVCSLNGDPWTDAQDGTVEGPVWSKLQRSTPTTATVRLTFGFKVDDSTEQAARRIAWVFLQRPKSSACWQVANLVSRQTDLRATLLRSKQLIEQTEYSPSRLIR